ncbi:xanthine dehydrogenase family protein molybdopterin-binding subunit [Orrella sp. JC864]|uniref:xanthine dehydrogenase family protein molybdopterin-binding subunit n=1 Tax=Orrella sp. JC864 TaxID=3120298 RepID=UPI0012BD3299
MQSAVPHAPAQPAIGGAHARVDGPLKVSGLAPYTADRHFEGMVYAMPVRATIARGRILRIDSGQAAAMPGVRKIYTRENIGPLYRVAPGSGVSIDEKRPPLSDDRVHYYGQYVALVVARTLEQAQAAAEAVRVSYADEPPDVSMALHAEQGRKTESERGDPDAAFQLAQVRIDHTYTTPVETHNPIELHATVAVYDGEQYTLYETSQAVVNHRAVIVQMLGVEPRRVRVITEYLGSGFGGKLWPWTHAVLAAAAARDLKCPVRLEITRKMMFETVGHRSNTSQRIRLSASLEGRLTSIRHDYLYHASRLDHMKENCGEATPYLYSTPNLRVTSGFSRRDIAPNTSMRGPGAVPGMFALESAMDELAVKLRIDPVELRLRNEPRIDESRGVPFSTRHLAQCLREGARRFGWARRDPRVGAMRRDGQVLGWGMACASWLAKRLPAQAELWLQRDGTVRIASATQDLGTGTYTVMAQMAAHATGLPLARMRVELGDTALPEGPVSGGSMATGSMVPAVLGAARSAIGQLLACAAQSPASPYQGQKPDALVYEQGKVRARGEPAGEGVPFEAIIQGAGLSHLAGQGRAGPSDADDGADQRSMHSYGAHFVEVGWRPELAQLRVNRIVTVIDAGRIINPRTGRNQIEGALVMGLGMALLEETEYDARHGAPINSNLADYLVATHADTPEMDVVFLDHPDTALNELGARGIGEIGLAGVAAAVTAAVHHATGVRVRDLPVRIEDLLGG